MLFIFGGLPGTGKTTLASALARELGAVYLRIDTIEQAMRDSGFKVTGPVGYNVAYQLALENLRLGNTVVTDSVNPLNLTRDAWRDVAFQAKMPFTEIEIICSDEAEHRNRVETRSSDIGGLSLPTWQQVREREYEIWERERIVINTAGETARSSFERLLKALNIRPSRTNESPVCNNESL